MAGPKPIDVGSGAVCASFGADGSWLSLGAVHPELGFVELNALPVFDERQRGDPDATRRHRVSMTAERFAFLRVTAAGGEAPVLVADLADPVRPRWSGHLGSARLSLEAAVGADGRSLVQRWRLDRPTTLHVRFEGRLDRPALAEITEINPPSPSGATTLIEAAGRELIVRAPVLEAAARLGASHGGWQPHRPGSAALVAEAVTRLELSVGLDVDGWPAGAGTASRVESSMSANGRTRRAEASGPRLLSVPNDLDAPLDRLLARALSYVRGCTALAAGERERVILTDHRLLPLSWTRDGYYQALLLLAAGETDTVADHLRWLWRRCERPDGRWVRSHHANGRRKDLAFQADQQLYPIVELADYWRATGELPAGVSWGPEVVGAWRAALEELAPNGLISSRENAADDPAAAPLIAASQILLWYTARRLAELCQAGAMELDLAEIHEVADRTIRGFRRILVRGGRWMYAADERGATVAYHDANDLPTALAPLWGFCQPHDPEWRATMAFAFSPDNPGFTAGRFPGLGSLHTAGPWTLGDVQAWLVASLTDDPKAARRALERLIEVAFDDGALPEAYAADDPQRRVRHWFAWPGAVLGALLLLDRDGLLEARLAAGQAATVRA